MIAADYQQWVGARIDDVYGARVGKVCAVYHERESEEPLWLLVRTGRTRPSYRAVPVAGAAYGNGRVWVPYQRGQVISSPPIAVQRPVSTIVEGALCRHYEVPATPGARAGRWTGSVLFALGDSREPGAWAAMLAAS